MRLYENRIIGFIDILGWSELVQSSAQNEHLLVSIDSAASFIAELSQFTPQINQTSKQLADEFTDDGISFDDLKSADLRSTHFSDTIVFSSPINKVATSQLVSCIIGLSIVLLRAGYYVRGAITKGLLHHTSHSLYGPALIKAYEIENKNAIYPRIVLTPDIFEYFVTSEWIEEDCADGMFFLNVLYHTKEKDISVIESALEINIRKNGDNFTKLQKLNWLKNFIARKKVRRSQE